MQDEPFRPRAGYAALRRFRESRAAADYFITFNTQERRSGLACPQLIGALRRTTEDIERKQGWSARCGVVMPDHVHMVVRLGEAMLLPDCVRLFKGRLAPSLREYGLRWQEGFYDRKLRSVEELRAVFLYVYLNPYRAALIRTDESWPGYFCSLEDWNWFQHQTRESWPEPDWLR